MCICNQFLINKKIALLINSKITVQFREGWDKMNFVTLTSDEFDALTKHFSHYTQSAIDQ